MAKSKELKKAPTGEGVDPLTKSGTIYSEDVQGDAVKVDRQTKSVTPSVGEVSRETKKK